MKYVILGHENPDVDSIVSGYLLEKIMLNRGYDVKYIIPDKEISKETEDLCNKFDLYLGEYKNQELIKDAKYILVDHNVRDVPGEIVAVIDHHPTNDMNANYTKIEKASSTACMIAMECEEELESYDIKLACLATFVDTASFHSTKTRKSDISWINEMCTKYDFDYDDFYRDGLCLTDLKSIDEILFNGIKKYDFDGVFVHSSYIQVNDMSKVEGLVDDIINKLQRYILDNDINLYVFIIYDMSRFYTKAYIIGSDNINIKEYSMYASRGNTIIPDVKKEYCDNK